MKKKIQKGQYEKCFLEKKSGKWNKKENLKKNRKDEKRQHSKRTIE